jgi:ATP-dependent DNA ligase
MAMTFVAAPLRSGRACWSASFKAASCPCALGVGHVIGKEDWLFEMAHNAGCEGIVSKRLGSVYRSTQHIY